MGLRRIHIAADITRRCLDYILLRPIHSASNLYDWHFVGLSLFPSLRQQCRRAIYMSNDPLSGMTFLLRSEPALTIEYFLQIKEEKSM